MNFDNKIIYGWAKSSYSRCDYIETNNLEQIAETFDFAKKIIN